MSDLVALTPAAYLRLWRFLADLDLSDTVEWDRAPVDDPLSWALVDPFLARVTRLTDALWVRVLDVPAALAARPWGRDGEVVLEVADPLGHAAGRFRVVTRDGVAEVDAPPTRTPTCGWTPRPSGALHLGGVAAETLRRAGRLSGAATRSATLGGHGGHRPGAVLHHRLLSGAAYSARTRLLRGLCSSSTRPSPSSSGGRYIPNRPR